MRLDPLSQACGSAACPQLFASDHGTFVVQGKLLAPDEVGVPMGPGEALVEIPREILLSALRDLRTAE
jgi:hypothetical protein